MGHFFLSSIENLISKVWYKKELQTGIHIISHWLKVMAKDARVKHRVTNKSGTLVEKLSFMTILCHFGRIIPNIRENLDASF